MTRDAKRTHAIGDAIGLAVHDADAAVVDAERIGANLRDHRLDPLPDRGGAGDNLDGARRIDRDPNAVERTEAALLHEHRETDSDRFARLPPRLTSACNAGQLDRGQRLVEQALVVPGIERDMSA